MFTGLVTAVGRVARVERGAKGLTLRIRAPWRGVRRGESIAVDGACLTVERLGRGWFEVHVIATSLDRTGFEGYQSGRRINLERSVRAGDRLGGHLVQGHVDGVGRVRKIVEREDARLIDIAVPAEVASVSIPLGSITVDGVSLTVNARPAPDVVQVSLIPETLRRTTLGERTAGDAVHLEADLIGKYVAALVRPESRDQQ
ncbi:MAG TPA: riboflavin synthase [Gemmatimonadales bacterium]|nr:riboflavin synthase [Gemmatimonadales bacterium]